MTQVIIDDIIPRTQLVATSGQTVFNTNWTADVASDVLVYARATGVDPNDVTQLISSSNYNVTFIGASQTVRVTFLVGRTINDIITIVRDTPAERLNLYVNTNFTPSMLNQDFSILTLVDQQAQMYDYVVNPGYNVSAIIEPVVDTVLPILGANQIWAMNPTRTQIIPYDVPSGGGLAPSDATYLLQVADSDLPNAQAMGALATGFVVNTITTGVQLSRVLTGVANQTAITNGTGLAGNPIIGIADNAILPGNAGLGIPTGTTAQRPGSPVGTEFRFNSDLVIIEYWNGSAWVQLNDAGGVLSGQGTENQVLVNGTFGTQETGDLIFTLPQDIALVSSPTFANLKLTNGSILDINGNTVLQLSPIAVAVNHLAIVNNIAGFTPELYAEGADTDINMTYRTKGAGRHRFISHDSGSPFVINSGTGAQHATAFAFADTAFGRVVTWQDASGTVAFLADIPGGTPSALTKVDDTNVTLTLGGTPATALLQPTSLTLGWTGLLSSARGGTGVNNGSNTLTLAGNLATAGAFGSTFNFTALTSVTFPTSGTLATTAQLPTPAALTRTDDTNVTITLGGTPTTALLQATSLTMGWAGQLSLARGGTNANLTASLGGLFYSTAAGGAILSGTATANQIPMSGSNAAPAWSTATYPPTTTINQILFSSAANTITGISSANSATLLTSATGVPSMSASMTNGQVLVGSTGASPAPATLTAGTGISIVNAANSITISSSGADVWVDQTTTPITMTSNTGYTSDAGASLITFTLPTTSAIGDSIEINGKAAGLWKIAQAASQQIHVGNVASTAGTGGSVASTNQFDCIRLRCITANTIWNVVSQQSAGLTIV